MVENQANPPIAARKNLEINITDSNKNTPSDEAKGQGNSSGKSSDEEGHDS